MIQMNKNKRDYIKFFIVVMAIIILFGCAGCGRENPSQQGINEEDPEQSEKISISGDGVAEPRTFTLEEMKELRYAQFEHIYSTVNNWPTRKKYAARGVLVKELLKAAGIKDDAKSIVFVGDDEFNMPFTREQLLETDRYYFPNVLEGDSSNAVLVEPLLAYEYMEGSDDLNDVQPDDICLIVPQEDIDDQTNIAFIKNVKQIVVSTEDPGKWDLPTAFPISGEITRGDKVKLQHKDMSVVKIFYTIDGTDPKQHGILYNPSTYQLDLNEPIQIDDDTVVKAFVKGFGQHDSDVATFEYKVK
jgi:hypothetical protein